MDEADEIVIISCSVRQSADNRVFGQINNLAKLKIKNLKFKIVLTGCMMRYPLKWLKEKLPGVDEFKKISEYPSCPSYSSCPSKPLAGALFLFNKDKSHYWEAASTRKGNRLSAPSLLVWEGIKIARQKGCKIFDLEGIYDERFPNKSWLGFTHFKKEFGGKQVEFPPPIKLF